VSEGTTAVLFLRALGFFLLVTLAAPSALAEPHDAAAAEALFRQGREAADAGDHAKACEKFKESNRLDPALGTVFNIADCEEKLGRLATAWQLFQEVAQRLPASDERQGIAKERARALEPRLPRLAVRLAPTAPAKTQVQRDGVELGSASLDTPLPVDPGPHNVTATAPDHEPRVFDVVLREAESQTVEVEPGAKRAKGVVTEVSSDQVPSSNQRTVGYVLGGIGLVGLAVGTVAGVMVLERKSTVDDNCDAAKRCNTEGFDAAESGRTLGVVSTAGLVIGALGVASGAYLILSSPKEQGPSTALVTSATPRAAGLSLLHVF
jgi:hypothetical protein